MIAHSTLDVVQRVNSTCTRILLCTLLGVVAPTFAVTVERVDVASLRTLVSEYHAQSKHRAAVDTVAQAFEQLSNKESPEAAELLLIQTDSLVIAGQPELALQSAERAWKIRANLYGQDDNRTLDALNEYLDNCPAAGIAKTCEPLAIAAIRKYEMLGNEKAPGLAALIRSHSLITNALGRPSDALLLLDRAIGIWRQNGDLYRKNVLNALTGQSVLLRNLGRFAESLRVIDELLPLQRLIQGDRSPDVLATLSGRASALLTLGRLDEAFALSTEVVQQRTEALGGDNLATLRSRIDLALILRQLGRISDAITSLATTAEILEKQQGPAGYDALIARYYLGVSMREGGLLSESVDVLTHVVETNQRAGNEQHPSGASYLTGLATSLQQLGSYDLAIAMSARAQTLHEKLRGKNHPDTLKARMLTLAMRERAGKLTPTSEALDVFAELTKRLALDHPSVLAAQYFYATLLGRDENLDEAIAEIRAVVDARTQLLGATHRDTLIANLTYARFLLKTKRMQEAAALLERLVPNVNAYRRTLAPLGSTAQRQEIQRFQALFTEHVDQLARAGRLEDAFVAADAYKARSLLDQLARQRSQEAGVALETQQRLSQLSSQLNSLESLSSSAVRAESRLAYLDALRAANAQFDDALVDARTKSPAFAALLDIPSITSKEFSLLNKSTAMIHFLEGFDAHWYAIVRTRTGNFRWFELGAQNGLQGTIEALRVWTGASGDRFATDAAGNPLRIYRIDTANGKRWIASGARKVCETQTFENAGCLPEVALAVHGTKALGELRRHLSERLLKPLLPAIADAQQLLISPEGTLGSIPWDTLLVRERPQMQRWIISLTPSLSVLHATQRERRTDQAMLAFAASDAGMVGGVSWPSLPNAEREARAAAELFHSEGSKAVVGKQASESALRELSKSGELIRYRRILVAAHGRFSSDRQSDRTGNAIVLVRDGDTPENDGMVTLSDWISIPLKSELVVLSACETALGQAIPGEGLIGFSYALNIAGNRDLVATLWKVDDRPAALFVLDFLKRVRQGKSHAQALTLSKRAFARHSNEHLRNPKVWGAFVLIGQ